MTQLTYLEAIAETNAGTATVLQYLCPVGILAYTCIIDKVAPTLTEVFSMLLAIGGTFLIATMVNSINWPSIPKVWLGSGVNFTYALYIILPLNLIQKWGSMLVIGVGMTIPGILMLPFVVFFFFWKLQTRYLDGLFWLGGDWDDFCLYSLSERNLFGRSR